MKKVHTWLSLVSIGILALGSLTACSDTANTDTPGSATTTFVLQELSKQEQQEVINQVKNRGIPTLDNLEGPVEVKMVSSLNYKKPKTGSEKWIEVQNFVCAELDEKHEGFDEYVEAIRGLSVYKYTYNKDSGWKKQKIDDFAPMSSQYFLGEYILFTNAKKDKDTHDYIVFGYDCSSEEECGEGSGIPFSLTVDEKYRPTLFQYATVEDDNGNPFNLGATFDWKTKETCTIPEDVKNSAIEVK